jgi:maleamate amidohydrolase
VIYKYKPSVFFGTPFTSFLNDMGCDSLLVAGTTTSGCVRATVIDAFSYNYRVAVVEEACFDRSQVSHAVSLCDMHAKYADVVRAAEVLTYIDGLPDGIFKNLPSGKPR